MKIKDMIAYSRKYKKYEVTDLESGFSNFFTEKPDAFKAAIFVNNQRLHRVCELSAKKHPQLEARLWKAAEMIADKSIKLADKKNIVAISESGNMYGPHTVALNDNGLLMCSCPDWGDISAPIIEEKNGLLNQQCKHVIATKILQFLLKE